MTGFGTVVTGTLLDGTFKIGQEVEIYPEGLKTRIRSLQTHKHQVEVARPGSRVAINLPNIARTDLARGNVVALPGQIRPTVLLDARIELLADAKRPLAHNTLVDFYSGSQEIAAHVRLLDVEELQPGHSAWVQLRFSTPAIVARRDRFILRIPSPSITIGGGEVIDVHPRYHRRFQPQIIAVLERLAQGSPEELVLAALDRRNLARAGGKARQGLIGYELSDVARQSNLAEDVTRGLLETFLSEGRVRKIGTLWFAQHIWDMLVEEAILLVSTQHKQYPLRSGLSKEEWRTRLNLPPKVANDVFAVLQEEGKLAAVSHSAGALSARTGGLICLPGFVPGFTPAQQRQVEQLVKLFQASPYTPPGLAEAEAIVGTEVLTALVEQGRLIKLGDGILFLRETYDEAVARLITYIREHGQITVAEARDVLGATRKYILPLLEHMDALHITRRAGDVRLLGTAAV